WGGCATTQVCQSGSCVCGCPAGQVCLGNGSCATACIGSGCAAPCECGPPNIEGQQLCIPDLQSCAEIPLLCTRTTDCPPGQTCEATGCGPGGSVDRRCVPLCNP